MAHAAVMNEEWFSRALPRNIVLSVTVLALLVPALALISADGGPAALYLAALLGVTLLGAHLVRGGGSEAWRTLWPMAIALAAPVAAMLIADSLNGSWSDSELEKLLRFALVIPIAWVLLHAPKKWLSHVQWALIFSAFAGAAMLLVILLSPSLGRGAVSAFGGKYNAVAFANLTLFFGMASWLSLPWTLSRWKRCEQALKILAGILAICAVWVSETRSSWGLFVVLSFVVLMSRRQWTMFAKLKFVGVAVVVMAVGMFALSHAEHSRFRELWTDMQRYEHQDRDTSTGIRMQLWTAAWRMFKTAPLEGVGVVNFRKELAKLKDQDVVTALVASDFGEPHNDFLGATAGYGIMGLLSVLALYFIPAGIFLRRLRSTDVVVHTVAMIGLLFTLGYAQFSLTEMMFRNMRSVPIYAVTVAILFALSSPPLSRYAVTASAKSDE